MIMSSLFSQSTISSVLDFNISFKMWASWFWGVFWLQKSLCAWRNIFARNHFSLYIRDVDSVNYKTGFTFYLGRKKGSDHCRNHLHNILTKVMYFFCCVATFISHICHQRKHFIFEMIQ